MKLKFNLTVLFGISFLIAERTVGQNPQLEFKRAVVFYNLSTFRQERPLTAPSSFNPNISTTTHFQLFYPTVALRWRTSKKNFHEVEITRLSLGGRGAQNSYYVSDSTGSTLVTGTDVYVATEMAVRYEYMLTFNKNKDKKLVPALGFAALPGFLRRDMKYFSSAIVPAVIHDLTFEAQVVPRLSYFPGERFFLDVNIPLSLFYAHYQSFWNGIPGSPQPLVSDFNVETLPVRFSFRVGMGLKF